MPMLLQRCSAILMTNGTTFGQLCVNVIPYLAPHVICNLQDHVISQHCHNVVTTFPEYYNLIGFQCWTPMFIPHWLSIVLWSHFNTGLCLSHKTHTSSHNIAWILCNGWYITLFPRLYQCCGNVVNLHNFPMSWHPSYNVIPVLWQY